MPEEKETTAEESTESESEKKPDAESGDESTESTD